MTVINHTRIETNADDQKLVAALIADLQCEDAPVAPYAPALTATPVDNPPVTIDGLTAEERAEILAVLEDHQPVAVAASDYGAFGGPSETPAENAIRLAKFENERQAERLAAARIPPQTPGEMMLADGLAVVTARAAEEAEKLANKLAAQRQRIDDWLVKNRGPQSRPSVLSLEQQETARWRREEGRLVWNELRRWQYAVKIDETEHRAVRGYVALADLTADEKSDRRRAQKAASMQKTRAARTDAEIAADCAKGAAQKAAARAVTKSTTNT